MWSIFAVRAFGPDCFLLLACYHCLRLDAFQSCDTLLSAQAYSKL